MSSEFSAFIKSRRRSIDATSVALGFHTRSFARVGKRVTQEEVAEAIGVSHAWYAMLESGSARHPSVKVVTNLSSVLMLNSTERDTLSALSIPEIHTTRVSSISTTSIEKTVPVFHVAIKRLLSASSNAAALAIAGEELAGWFNDTSLIVADLKHDVRSIAATVLVRTRSGMRITSWPERSVAVIDALPQERRKAPRLLPIDIGKPALESNVVHVARSEPFAPEDLERADFICGTVRMEDGLVISISAHHKTGHAYSIEDQLFVACLADFLGFMSGIFIMRSRPSASHSSGS